MPLSGQAPFAYSVSGTAVDSVVSDLCPGTYSVTLTDQRGCSWTEEARLETPAAFQIDLGKDVRVRKGSSLTLNLETNLPATSIEWSAHCDTSCGSELTFIPDASQVIHVTAVTETGCTASDSINVTLVNPVSCQLGLAVPSAFTPNGDGHNERFAIYTGRQTTDIQHIGRLMIFNRWGNVVYERAQCGSGRQGRCMGWLDAGQTRGGRGLYMGSDLCPKRRSAI